MSAEGQSERPYLQIFRNIQEHCQNPVVTNVCTLDDAPCYTAAGLAEIFPQHGPTLLKKESMCGDSSRALKSMS